MSVTAAFSACGITNTAGTLTEPLSAVSRSAAPPSWRMPLSWALRRSITNCRSMTRSSVASELVGPELARLATRQHRDLGRVGCNHHGRSPHQLHLTRRQALEQRHGIGVTLAHRVGHAIVIEVVSGDVGRKAH